LFAWLPLSLLRSILQRILNMPPDAATTTASFLQSPSGVRESL
jgi:hypothetical protein